eukprot:scaffold11698_cov26-Tisochrysis_lutea.AAC.1
MTQTSKQCFVVILLCAGVLHSSGAGKAGRHFSGHGKRELGIRRGGRCIIKNRGSAQVQCIGECMCKVWTLHVMDRGSAEVRASAFFKGVALYDVTMLVV